VSDSVLLTVVPILEIGVVVAFFVVVSVGVLLTVDPVLLAGVLVAFCV